MRTILFILGVFFSFKWLNKNLNNIYNKLNNSKFVRFKVGAKIAWQFLGVLLNGMLAAITFCIMVIAAVYSNKNRK